MRMMRIRMNEIAKALNTSKATTYRLIKKHKKILSENNENHLRKDENGQYLTLKGLNILASLENKILESTYSDYQNENDENLKKTHSQNEKIDSHFENSENQNENHEKNNQTIPVEIFKEQLQSKDETISNLLEDLRQERNRHDTIIMTLTQQIQNQSMQLEDLRTKKEEVKKSKKINKTLKRDLEQQEPESKPTFKQKIIYFFKPHLQRKRA